LESALDNMKSSLFAARSIRQQVSEFHRAFGVAIVDKPAVPDAKTVRLRAKLITEECLEMLESLFGRQRAIDIVRDKITEIIDFAEPDCDGGVKDILLDTVNIVGFADALADIDYVVEGSRLAFGIDGLPVAAEVHRSNMAKLGPDGKPIVREDGKRLKPEGWTPPDIENELRKQGWDG
jgi:predicted HAD superfamily Cof-like phosphohydrolase